MPWEVRIYSTSGDSLSQIVRQTQVFEEFLLDVDFEVRDLAVDPDQWVLRDLVPGTGVEGDRLLANVSANPSPGPFTIEYEVPPDSSIDIDLFDVQGRRVRQLVRDDSRTGLHRVVWDGRDSEDEQVASGTYFARAKSGSRTDSQRILLLH